MENIVKKITDNLIYNNLLSSNKRAVFEYKLQIKLLTYINYIIFLGLGLATNHLIEIIVFLTAFLKLRESTSGYHASSPVLCFIYSCIIVLSIYNLGNYIALLNINFQIIIILITVLTILLFSPINHINLNLTKNEMNALKESLYKKLIIIFIIMLFLISIGFGYYNRYIILSLIFDAVFILIAKFTGQEVNLKNENV